MGTANTSATESTSPYPYEPLGLQHVPRNYDWLIIDVIGFPQYDTQPTSVYAKMYYQIEGQEKHVFLVKAANKTDSKVVVAMSRVLSDIRYIFHNDKVAVPNKGIQINIHNPYYYMLLTNQLDWVFVYQKRCRKVKTRFRKVLNGKEGKINLVNLNHIMSRESDNFPWRRETHKNCVPSEIESGIRFKEIFASEMQARQRVFHGK